MDNYLMGHIMINFWQKSILSWLKKHVFYKFNEADDLLKNTSFANLKCQKILLK